ncbi:MAG: DUF1800 domain-containing protein [Dehalococcoidia bacterium]|nr:DUF1800 domain-containing protein [Dehalococcoidia bacterium]
MLLGRGTAVIHVTAQGGPEADDGRVGGAMGTTAAIAGPLKQLISRRGFISASMLPTIEGLKQAAPKDGPSDPPPNPLADPSVRVAHLLRRAGFSGSKSELDGYTALGFEATVDYLLNYDAVADPIQERLDAFDFDSDDREALRRWWMIRMVHSTRPLQEKMTLFWHGLLTSGFSKVNSAGLLRRQNEFFRANALSNFRDIMRGISKDAAMLIWLDGRGSRKQHPNENYARELMELFTMGEGNYTEQDVLQAARAFTGWRVSQEGEVTLSRTAFDGGSKTFLGRTGRFSAGDIVDIILEQPATAAYLSRRLFSFFAYRNPPPPFVEMLSGVYFNSGYDIKAMVRAILLSEEFSSATAYRSQVRSPVDLAVGVHRAWGLETDGQYPANGARNMGQDVFDPPNVAGWPGGPAWLNSASWMSRANFVNGLVIRRKGPPATVIDLSSVVAANGISGPKQFKAFVTRLLLDGNLSPEVDALLSEYLFGSQPLTLEPRSLDRKGRTLVYLLMASPEYQLL